jgi:outer membrane protein
MNRGLLLGGFNVAGVVMAAALWIGGCGYLPEEKYYELDVAPEKLFEIDNLDLKEMEAAPGPAEPNAVAAEKMEITLEQARKLALENNLELKAELISPAIAEQRVREEEAKFEWAFFSNLSYRQIDTPPAEPLALSGSNVNTGSVDMGVQVPLQTGGTMTFDFVDTRTKSNQSSYFFNPAYDMNANFSISQPLLQGAGVRTNTYSIRVAEYDSQIQDASTKLEIIRVIAAVDRVYWRLYAARRELLVRQQEHELAQAQLERAKRFVASGEMSQVEIVRAEAGVANTLEGIINAENAVRAAAGPDPGGRSAGGADGSYPRDRAGAGSLCARRGEDGKGGV